MFAYDRSENHNGHPLPLNNVYSNVMYYERERGTNNIRPPPSLSLSLSLSSPLPLSPPLYLVASLLKAAALNPIFGGVFSKNNYSTRACWI